MQSLRIVNNYTIFMVLLFSVALFLSCAKAQSSSTIPISIVVESAAFLQPVPACSIRVELKEDFGNGNRYTERIGTFKTNETGDCTISVLPNKMYQVYVFRSGFFSQLLLLNTNNYSRSNKNRTKVSLRPKGLLTIRGKIISEREEPVEGTVTLIDKVTQSQRRNTIEPDGNYKIQGIKGESYQLHLVVEGLMDTVVDVAELREEFVMGELSFLFDMPLANAAPLKPDYVTGDSLILPNMQFVGKTADLSEALWLDTLAQKLLADSTLIIEIQVHTDARKSNRFNRILTQKRADLLQAELLGRQIPDTQFTIVARGEEDILNECGNNKRCSYAQHAVNNRTVLIVKEGELFLK